MVRKNFRVVRDTFARDEGLPFGKLLKRERVLSTLDDEGHAYRQGVFCPLVTLWGWLSQCLSQDKSLNEAVRRILAHRVANGLPACSASSASYSNARSRFPLSVMKRLAKEVGKQVHDSADDSWHWRGRDVYLVDGTALSMPDTPELQEIYPQVKTQAPGIGFPMMRAVAMISLPTGAVVDFAFDKTSGKGTGEGNLFRAMFDSVNRGDIIVADRLYPSFRSVAALQLRGADMVSVSHHARKVDFTEGVQLGENDHIVEWHAERQLNRRVPSEELDSLPKSVFVREFLIDVDGRDGRRESAIVVSTITDPTVPQKELSDLYWRRWNCELDLRSIKQSLHLDVLRCKTPDMVAKEIFCHLLAWNLLRGVMTESAKRNGVTPRQLSVKAAMQTVESFTPAMMLSGHNEAMYNVFLSTVAAHRVGNRPGRLEPRFKKRRPAWGEYMTIPRSKSRRRLASQARSLR